MAQKFKSEVPTALTSVFSNAIESRENENTLKSGFSGTAYPSAPVAGQHCFRTDENKEYIYDGADWREIGSNETIGVDVKTATGTMGSLSNRLSVAINPDGTLKDNITANVDEFKVSGMTPTFIDNYHFSIDGDVAGIFTAGRMLRIALNGDVLFTTVINSVFSLGVTVIETKAEINNKIAVVDYSIIQYGIPAVDDISPASESVAGIIQLATQEEVNAGVVNNKTVTPATYKAGLPTVPSFATQAEVNAGAITNKTTSPATVKTLVTTATSGMATITSGSNTWGRYTRFSDGTQLLGATLSIPRDNYAVPAASSYKRVISFPAGFNSTGYQLTGNAIYTLASTGSINTATYVVTFNDKTATGCTIYVRFISGGETDNSLTSITIDYHGYGTWK